jgi:hypothetical protein
MATYKKWSSSETEFIQQNHTLLCDEVLAVKLSQITSQNITTAMVRRQRRKLTLKKARGRPKKNKIVDNTTNDSVVSN